MDHIPNTILEKKQKNKPKHCGCALQIFIFSCYFAYTAVRVLLSSVLRVLSPRLRGKSGNKLS